MHPSHGVVPSSNAIIFHADSLIKVLATGGSVLLPVDTAGRVLELLLLLDMVKISDTIAGLCIPVSSIMCYLLVMLQYWDERRLQYPIYFLTNVSTSTVDYVKSFLEWMGDQIAKSFESSRANAFLLKYDLKHKF